MTKNSWYLKLAIVSFFTIISIQQVSSQITNVTIDVSNLPPVINSITASNPVLLTSNMTNVWCNSSVRDENGLSEIISKKAVLWNVKLSSEESVDNPATHYTSTSVEINPGGSISGILSSNFSLHYNAVPGIWRC